MRPLPLSLRGPSSASSPLCRGYKSLGDRYKSALEKEKEEERKEQAIAAGIDKGVGSVKKWINEWTLPQQHHPLDGRLRALLVVTAVAAALAVFRRFMQPNDHELLIHAAVIAERDPDIMLSINKLDKKSGKKEEQGAMGALRRFFPDDVQSKLRVSDPLMLRVGLVYDSDVKFDMAFSAPPPPPLPDGSLPVWDQTPNRTDLWATLPDTNFGTGQLHIIGRRIPEAMDKVKKDGRRADGKFDVNAVAALRQQQQQEAEAIAAAKAAATPVLTPMASWMHEPLLAKPLEWEVVTLELIFPDAQPFPMAFVLDPQLQAFVKKSGIDCPPVHQPPSLARTTLVTMREMAAFIAPNTLFSGLVWLVATVPVGYKLFASRVLPAQRSWSRRLANSLRDHPVLRETMGLQSSGLGLGFSRPKVTFMQESSAWGKKVVRDSKGVASLQDERSKLVQTYVVRNKVNDKTAKVHVEAQKVLMEALWGRVHYRTWKVTQASIQTPGGAKLKLQGIKVGAGL